MYPAVTLPLPRGTPNVSSLIKWDHSQSWAVATAEKFVSHGAGGGAQLTVEVDITSQESKDYYLVGHAIDGRILFPATGYLVSCLMVGLHSDASTHSDVESLERQRQKMR